MYIHFFGFKEKPFKLVPDPAYLYLSKGHEIALAHLTYALDHGDGFVEITGEVGTGKTTLCRAFLENLDDKTNAAYIFNPKLGPKQLLKSIHEELGVNDPGVGGQADIKTLIDSLNRFLMQQKSLGVRVVVLIDEAQNLQRNVLEQLRLLSNLETAKEKLLQIILVGQPELSQKLDSFELRQLSQRIGLRYRIAPLSAKETRAYIRFRLKVAAPSKEIRFNRSALGQIFSYSGGIPRLINIACDRALLAAYGLNQHRISGRIARASIKELRRKNTRRRRRLRYLFYAGVLVAVVGAAAFYAAPLGETFLSIEPPADKTPKPVVFTIKAPPKEAAIPVKPSNGQNPAEAETPKPAAAIPVKPEGPVALVDALKQMDGKASRQSAWSHVLKQWQSGAGLQSFIEPIDDDDLFFSHCARASGFSIHKVDADYNLLRRLNLPAILTLELPGKDRPGYMVLDQIKDVTLVLCSTQSGSPLKTDQKTLNAFWKGATYIPWKNFMVIIGSGPGDMSPESVLGLKLLLAEIGAEGIQVNKRFDRATKLSIKKIQLQHGIPADGIVGPLTKIVLYRTQKRFDMPCLIRPG